jgi:hypothetical protein
MAYRDDPAIKAFRLTYGLISKRGRREEKPIANDDENTAG